MQILRVCDAQTEKAFSEFPVKLYHDNPHWSHISNSNLSQLFDPEKNSFFKNGDAERWVITNFRGNMIGRIAAFASAGDHGKIQGGIGYFDCIDHPKAAELLLDQCKDWLLRKNVNIMYGPSNFFDSIFQEGLLTEGFEEQALFGMSYHFDYYQNLLKEYGLKPETRRFHYLIDVSATELPQGFVQKATQAKTNGLLSIKKLDKKNWERYVPALQQLFVQEHLCNAPGKENFQEQFESLVPMLSEDLALLACQGEEVVGAFILLPEPKGINRYAKSSLKLLDRVKLLFDAENPDKISTLVFGVKEGFKNQGIGSSLANHMFSALKKQEKYQRLEISNVHEEDEKAILFLEKMGGIKIKTFQLFEKRINLGEQGTAEDVIAHKPEQPSEVKARM